ncbi:MAG: Coenzyme F420 hydrogenase/dehydrogenase, beta subunit C-terminal domain [Clostridia bacterium]|nr:Coenzyme F420 hydrogenase/dehydrogenase, beta subunit C-terminal domain [Clostridia bacterium]
MTICDREKCSGCFACLNVCPKNCISMVEGKLGHIYPQIDESVCINCGACARVCPQNDMPPLYMPRAAYATKSATLEEYENASSGGLASVLSRKILAEGGVVFGCGSDMSEGIKHIKVETEDDLWLLRGSKYVQSHIDSIYREIKEELKGDKRVLFIGTPCQVGGLIKYLGKNPENLITADLICHGVPSQRLLFEHLRKVGADGGKYITFREKAGLYIRVSDSDKNPIYYCESFDDDYYLGFLCDLTLRDSCHNCSFSKNERCSDITIGDFWGLSKEAKIKKPNGISIALINTDKGSALFDSCGELLESEERPLSEAFAGNTPLRRPVSPAKDRNKFISNYEKKGFKKAIRKALFKKRLRSKTIRFLQKSRLFKKLINILRHK